MRFGGGSRLRVNIAGTEQCEHPFVDMIHNFFSMLS
jgi:hypothetical protein